MKDKKNDWGPMSAEDQTTWNKCIKGNVVTRHIVIVIALAVLVALIFFLDTRGTF